jgi:5-methylcytosine-specific restriction protein A
MRINKSSKKSYQPQAASWGTDTQWYRQAAWRKLRAKVLEEAPLCVMCDAAGKLVRATVVDHIKPVRLGGERYNERNLQPLCEGCHNAKSALEGTRKKGG